MEILDQLEALDLDALDAADLYILAYRLNESAQRAAALMLERSSFSNTTCANTVAPKFREI